jgi:hypothetical protein
MDSTNQEELRMKMVEFSNEKNRSVTALLGLYGFLNLAAIGIIFYIAQKR